jgi:hypothetical protein
MQARWGRRPVIASPANWPTDRAAVDLFMVTLDHPHKAAINLIRQIVCAVDPEIAEGIKWNAPSFRAHEWFATIHLRAKSGVGLILHRGAKARSLPAIAIDDPQDLLEWLGPDRAMIHFSGTDAVLAASPALTAIIRQWIRLF